MSIGDIVKITKTNKKKFKEENIVVDEDSTNADLLVQKIDELYEGANGKIWKQSDTFAPSSTNPCPRYAIYRFRGFEQFNSFPANIRRIFDIGHKVEDQVAEIFENLGILVDREVEVRLDDPPIGGFIDFIIDFGGHKIIECKSINDRGYSNINKMKIPKDEHYKQIQVYMEVSGIDDGFILYYNKNNSRILPLYIKKNETFIDNLFSAFREIYEVHKRNELPKRPYKAASKTCKNCDAKDWCWSDDQESVEVELPKIL